MDGSPMARLLMGDAPAARDFLIEYFGESVDGCAANLENDFPGRGWSRQDDGVNCGLRGPGSYVTPPLWDGNETWASIQDHTNNTYSCVRSVVPAAGAGAGAGGNAVDTQYCSWASGEAELFDLVADPWQLENLAPALALAQREALEARLAALRACRGCRACAAAGGVI